MPGNKIRKDLKRGLRNVAQGLAVVIAVLVLLAAFVYANRDVFTAIYAEMAFDGVRYGPYTTMAEVDDSLSWFHREEVSKDFVDRPLFGWSNKSPIMQRDDVTFISYYIGDWGFVVVFDLSGTKITQIKTDV